MVISALLGPRVGRTIDRVRRPRGAGRLEPADGRRPDRARPIAVRPAHVAGLGGARRGHGARALRCRLRHARPHLRRDGAAADHRHHAVRRFRQHGRLAAVGVGARRDRLAAYLLCMGGRASPDRAAAQPAAAAEAWSGARGACLGGDSRRSRSIARWCCWRSRSRPAGWSPARWARICRAFWRRRARRRSRRSRRARCSARRRSPRGCWRPAS